MNVLKTEFDPSCVGPYQHLLFSRGWVVSREKLTYAPDCWQTIQFYGLGVRYDPKLTAITTSHVLLLGDIFDTNNPYHSNEDVLATCEARLEKSREDLLSYLNSCNGSYVLLFFSGAHYGVEVINDATGLSGVFYDSKCEYASSHSLLVALNAFKTFSVERYDIFFKFGFPGRFTPYKGIYHLNPSLVLSLGHKRIQRYALIDRNPMCSLEDVFPEFSRLMRNTILAFSQRKSLVMSLTAGFDSRTALSACRCRDNIEYFTYYRADDVDTDAVDRVVAQKLSEQHGLSHSVIQLRQSKTDEFYLNLCKINSHYSHIPAASFNYYRIYGERDVFHLRSNLSEIGRAFYRTRVPQKPEYPGVAAAMECYLSKAMRESPRYDESLRRNYQTMFLDYIVSSETNRIHQDLDYRDVFYWEHRMGNWHNQVVSESLPAFVSLSAYNSGQLLNLMLSVPFEERQNNSLMKRMMESCWPELMEIPINPKSADGL